MSEQPQEKKPKSSSTNEALSEQQKRFCLEYIQDLNGKQAAIRAGYAESNAEAQASRMLTNPKISEACQRLMDERAKRTKIDADAVLVELVKLAKSDIRKFFNDDGSLKAVKDFPDDVAASVSSVEVDELFEGYGQEKKQVGFTKKLKFWDKPKCLEMIGKHLKMFTDVVDVNVIDERPFKDLSDAELDKILSGAKDDPKPDV